MYLEERLLLAGGVVIKKASHVICSVKDQSPEPRKDGINSGKHLGCVNITVACVTLGRIEMGRRRLGKFAGPLVGRIGNGLKWGEQGSGMKTDPGCISDLDSC